jgi:hypothetical protein
MTTATRQLGQAEPISPGPGNGTSVVLRPAGTLEPRAITEIVPDDAVEAVVSLLTLAVDQPAERGQDTSRALSEVRAVLSRAEKALQQGLSGPAERLYESDGDTPLWNDQRMWTRAYDPDHDQIRAALLVVTALLSPWQRTGTPQGSAQGRRAALQGVQCACGRLWAGRLAAGHVADSDADCCNSEGDHGASPSEDRRLLTLAALALVSKAGISASSSPPVGSEQAPEPQASTLARTLATAEDEIARYRRMIQEAASWIHDPAYDEAARVALARRLALPEPRTAAAASVGRSGPLGTAAGSRGAEGEANAGQVKPSAETEQGAWHAVWLHADWQAVTRPMTARQREYAAACVAAYTRRVATRDGREFTEPTGLRWWREGTT